MFSSRLTKILSISLKWNTNTGSRFRSNFLKIASANVLAQGLTLLSIPILTRLYTPADFGALALFMASFGVFVAFATFRYDWSIPNATSEIMAAALVLIGFLFLSVISTLLFVALFMVGIDWSFWAGFQTLDSLLFLLPIAVFGNGLYELMNGWFVRKAELTPVAKSRIFHSGSGVCASLIGGGFNLGALGLICSAILSPFIGAFTLIQSTENLRTSLKRLTLIRVKTTFIKYFWDSGFSSSVAVVNAASLAVIPILLAQYYPIKEIGWYALMHRMAVSPVSIFVGALSQSFWAEAAKTIKTDKDHVRHLYLKSTKLLAVVSIPLVLICLAGPLYVGPVFGRVEWTGAGAILASLAPLMIGLVIVQPLTHLVVHRKQNWKLVLDLVKFCTIITIIVFSPKIEGKLYILIFWISIVGLIHYIILFLLNYICLKK